MKKIIALIPFLFLIFACTDSELIIEGENVGDGSTETPTPITNVLKKFDYVTPFYNYQYFFNSEGKVTESSLSLQILGQTVTANVTLSYENGLVSQKNFTSNTGESVYSDQSNFYYDSQNRLIEINANTAQETKINLTYNTDNTITGVRTINGQVENTINFTLDSQGYVNGYSFTDVATNKEVSLTINLNGNLITSSELKIDDVTVNSSLLEYDNNQNPLYIQSIGYFNVLLFDDAFEFKANEPELKLDSYAFYRSENNITKLTNGQGTVLNYEYQYNSDNFPESAVLTIEGQEPGSITFTYY